MPRTVKDRWSSVSSSAFAFNLTMGRRRVPPGNDHLGPAHLLEPGLEFMGVIDLTAYLNPLDIAKVQ